MTELEHAPIYGYDIVQHTDNLHRIEYIPRLVIGSFKNSWPSLRFWGRISSRHFYSPQDAKEYAEKYFLHRKEWKPWEYVGDLTDVHGEDLISAFYKAKPAQPKMYHAYNSKTAKRVLYTIAKKG